LNEVLIKSFQQQGGLRGAHFYDGEHCEFVTWDLILEFCKKMKDRDNPAHVEFEDKLIHTIANVNPTNEFVLVCQTGGLVTIECYRQMGL